MNIHNFSETAFNDTAKEILVKESVIRDHQTKKPITDPDLIASDASFRENFDLSSLEIAELVIALEEKYNIKTIEISTAKIDSINDVRKLFEKSLQHTRQIAKLKGKITQQEIIDSLISIIADHQDLMPGQINANSKLKYDLKMDSLDILEVLMKFENKYTIRIEDDSKIKNIGTVNDFAEFLYNYINPVVVKTSTTLSQNLTKEDVFGIIYKHLYELYGISYTRQGSNWYTDLGRSSFELSLFYEWAEKEFNIKMPFFYFTNMDKLCDVILLEIKKRDAKNTFNNRIKRMFSRSK